MADNKQKQIDIAESLQLKLLNNFDKMLEEGTITPTDRATLVRLFMANGWRLDPHSIPQGLRGKLTELVDPLDFGDDPELN